MLEHFPIMEIVKQKRVDLAKMKRLNARFTLPKDYYRPYVQRTKEGWVITYGQTGPFKTKHLAMRWYEQNGK